MDELDFEYDDWNYYQVLEDQNRGINVLEVRQRLKLAEINQEQREWRLKREFEQQQKDGDELSKLKITENEVKMLKLRLKEEQEKTSKLTNENETLKAKIKKNDDQYADRKIEVETLIDLFLNESDEDFEELCNRLKYR